MVPKPHHFSSSRTCWDLQPFLLKPLLCFSFLREQAFPPWGAVLQEALLTSPHLSPLVTLYSAGAYAAWGGLQHPLWRLTPACVRAGSGFPRCSLEGKAILAGSRALGRSSHFRLSGKGQWQRQAGATLGPVWQTECEVGSVGV